MFVQSPAVFLMTQYVVCKQRQAGCCELHTPTTTLAGYHSNLHDANLIKHGNQSNKVKYKINAAKTKVIFI